MESPDRGPEERLGGRWVLSLGALLILPTVMVGASLWLKEAGGPYWLGSNSDPSYAYLFNGLSLLHLRPPPHVGHPGTPLQMLCALVIIARHGFMGVGALVDDVLRNPEAYLYASQAVLVGLYGSALVVVGWMILRLTRSLVAALLMQCTPFLSVTVLKETAWVRPESLQLTLVLLYAMLLLLGLRSLSTRGMKYFAATCGLLVGMLMATKVTALPLGVIPLLLLPSYRQLFQYALAAVGGFLICVAPVLSESINFLKWVARLATHTGRYGRGKIGLIETGHYFESLKSLLLTEAVFTGILLCSTFVLIRFWWKKTGVSESSSPVAHLYKGLLAVTVAEVLQLLLVAKHPGGHYLIPGLGLLGLNLVLWFQILSAASDRLLRLGGGALLVLVTVGGVACQGVKLLDLHDQLERSRQEQMAVYRQAHENYETFRRIRYYRSSSVEYALHFGDGFNKLRFHKELHRLYPDALFYNIWKKSYHNFGGRLHLKEIGAGAEGVIFQGSPFRKSYKAYLPRGIILEQLYPGKREVLYRLKSFLDSPSAPGRIEPRPGTDPDTR